MIRRSLSDRSLRACAGFHLFELVIVLAVIGVLLAMAYPRFRGFETRRETRNAVAAVAGVLQRAREDAIKTGVPHLVVVKPPIAGGGGGSCPGGGNPAQLQVVRDNDGSYSATPGDVVSDVDIDGLDDCSVALYGEGSDATPFPDLTMPSEDVGSTAQGIVQSLAGVVGGLASGISGSGSSGSGSNSGSGSSGSGSGGLGGLVGGVAGGVAGAVGGAVSGVASVVGSTTSTAVSGGGAAAGMTHGSTLPLGDDGLPVAAFSPAGWAVDPSTPGSAGSGSGAIYVTDGERSVYAAVVQPLGRVLVRGYDSASAAWK